MDSMTVSDKGVALVNVVKKRREKDIVVALFNMMVTAPFAVPSTPPV